MYGVKYIDLVSLALFSGHNNCTLTEASIHTSTCWHSTGETCGQVFWVKLMQRLHRLRPNNETYTSLIEETLVNGVISQIPPHGRGIRQFALLHKAKMPASNLSTCCEGQASRALGSIPEYVFSLSAAKGTAGMVTKAKGTAGASAAGADAGTGHLVGEQRATPAPATCETGRARRADGATEVRVADVYINMYMASRLTATVVKGGVAHNISLRVETNWPYNGSVAVVVEQAPQHAPLSIVRTL